MNPILKVVYNPVFVAQRLDKEAKKLSPDYSVSITPEDEYVISERDKPIYSSPSDQDIQVRLDRMRITRNFQRFGASLKDTK